MTNNGHPDAGSPPPDAGVVISDYAAAAFLVTRGHEMTGAEWRGREVVFIFTASAGADLDAFYRHAPAPALQYFGALRSIRNLIEQTRRAATAEVVGSRGVLRVPRRR